MRTVSFAKLLFISVAVLAFFGLSHADGLNNDEVEFSGKISSIAANGEGVGTIFISIGNFDLRVVVNSKTDLSDKEGKDIELSDLTAGMEVEVAGKYSASGIIASRIKQLSAADNSFDLRGHITAMTASGNDLLISLLGVTVVVQSNTKIMDDDVLASPSSLKVGMTVQVEGVISGSTWNATSVDILAQATKKQKVRFEGVVQAINGDLIQVAVSGLVNTVTPVHKSSNTLITGDLVEGAHIFVIGYLNADLSVEATEIRVLPALEIKPDERKLKVGETAVFTVKLRDQAAADVTVSLSSSDQAVLSLSTVTLTILKGQNVADFSATAKGIGSAEITAQALGEKATADVTVGEVSEDDNERPSGETRIAFAPDKIKLGLNQTRDVVLLVKPPQTVPVTVDLKPTDGLVTVTGSLTFPSGAALMKVTIKSGSKEGSDSVVATLPSSLGGGKAELVVKISSKKGGPDKGVVEIAFRPDDIELPVGESRSVILMLNHSQDKDVVVNLAVNISGIIEAPTSVTIPAGAKSVQVIVTGKGAGKAKLTAALPPELGTDTAELKVEVKS